MLSKPMTILFPDHNWTSGKLIGSNIVITDQGVTFQKSVKEMDIAAVSTPPQGYKEQAATLPCSVTLPVQITVEGEELNAVMCLTTYNAIVESMSAKQHLGGKTTFRTARQSVSGFVGSLRKCCGG